MRRNVLNWFEIPVEDMNRAKTFYEAAFGIKLINMDMPEMKMEGFAMENVNNGGALVKSEMHKPSAEGCYIYLHVDEPEMEGVLKRVEEAGGKVTMPKTFFGDDAGYVGMFLDTEGNNIGVNAPVMAEQAA